MVKVTDAPIAQYFGELDDPRIDRSKWHTLLDIITIALCGIIWGADSWVDIELFGKCKEDWFRTFLELPNGIPSHDTFGDVFARLDPEQFQRCFMEWVQAVAQVTQGEVVAIDGKTVRRSHDRTLGKKAIHIHMAARKGNSVVVALLLELGADLHAKGGHGFTPLHLASEFASDEAGLEPVRLLLYRGADIRARNDLGETPLFRSVHSYVDDYPATTALLLERGADPTARDVDGFTPLHRGVSSLKALPAVVELLLEYRADAAARSDSGLTPLDMAERHSVPPGVVQVLVDRKYRPDTEPTGTPGRWGLAAGVEFIRPNAKHPDREELWTVLEFVKMEVRWPRGW